MKINWDCLVWDTETVPDENEIRVRVEGRVSEIDDRLFHEFQENGIDINKITMAPAEDPVPDRPHPPEDTG